MRLVLCSALLAGATLILPVRASAQETFVERKTDDGQDIRFKDDPMSAIAGNPVGAQLTGFHPPRRFNLMPPRITFVPELLKTVEHF